jgi:hypothetical protein
MPAADQPRVAISCIVGPAARTVHEPRARSAGALLIQLGAESTASAGGDDRRLCLADRRPAGPAPRLLTSTATSDIRWQSPAGPRCHELTPVLEMIGGEPDRRVRVPGCPAVRPRQYTSNGERQRPRSRVAVSLASVATVDHPGLDRRDPGRRLIAGSPGYVDDIAVAGTERSRRLRAPAAVGGVAELAARTSTAVVDRRSQVSRLLGEQDPVEQFRPDRSRRRAGELGVDRQLGVGPPRTPGTGHRRPAPPGDVPDRIASKYVRRPCRTNAEIRLSWTRRASSEPGDHARSAASWRSIREQRVAL